MGEILRIHKLAWSVRGSHSKCLRGFRRLSIQCPSSQHRVVAYSTFLTHARSPAAQLSCKSTKYLQVYRSREVGQSYLTSVLTTLVAMVHAAWLVFSIRPELILCNGPGTGLPICIAGFTLKVLGIRDVKLVFVESVARVQKLSLTGLILDRLRLADQFFVQWPHLVQKYPSTQYVGRLMYDLLMSIYLLMKCWKIEHWCGYRLHICDHSKRHWSEQDNPQYPFMLPNAWSVIRATVLSIPITASSSP